jgi:hypothetical protein
VSESILPPLLTGPPSTSSARAGSAAARRSRIAVVAKALQKDPADRGRIEEARGHRAAAKKHYEKVLERWPDADPDLHQLIDTKARLAKL